MATKKKPVTKIPNRLRARYDAPSYSPTLGDPGAGFEKALADAGRGADFERALAESAAASTTYEDGGGGGSASTFAEPAPTRELATSPEWLAYLSQLGLEETQFRGDIEKQRGMASAVADQQLGDIAFTGTGERRNIAGGLESRGMARSGQFVRTLAEQRAREGRQSSNVQLGLANTVSGLESSLANKLMELASRRAQQELSMRASGYS